MPRCGSCSKKGRACNYKSAKNSKFVHELVESLHHDRVSQGSASSTPASASNHILARNENCGRIQTDQTVTLRLRRSRKAEVGGGEFSIFGRPADNGKARVARRQTGSAIYMRPMIQLGEANKLILSPSPALKCPQTTLAASWASIFSFEALNLNPLGDWVKQAWCRTGEDAYLDLAADYALQSMQAFQLRQPSSDSKTLAAGQRALRSLRAAFDTRLFELSPENMLVTVMLHYAAEVSAHSAHRGSKLMLT